MKILISLSYTYVDSDEEGFAGNRVKEVRRPRHIGSIGAVWRRENAGLSVNVSYTGEQGDDFFPPYPHFKNELNCPLLLWLVGVPTIN